jgi:beta-lactamase regulating signal transducer with metallopeptidase domain
MSLLATVSLDISIVLALATGAAWLLRRRSAATRHWILAMAIVCAAAVPVFELVTPVWSIPVPAWLSPPATSTLTVVSHPVPQGSAVFAPAPAVAAAPSILDRPEFLIVGAWVSGVVAALVGLLTGFTRLRMLRRRAHVIHHGRVAEAAADAAGAHGLRRPVLLLESDHPALVVTWGLLRPRVLLPAGSQHWTDERLRVVLSHELAHVRRGDWSMQILASLMQSIYWFNPLVWLACRQLRLESERACDDAVLSSGIAGPDYAAHLLAVARDAVRVRRVWTPANAIAHPSTLEGRIRAMLNARLNRAPLTTVTQVVVVFALGALTAVVSSAALSARSTFVSKDVVLAGGTHHRVLMRAVVAAPTPPAAPGPARAARAVPAAPVAPAPPTAPAAPAEDQTPATLSGVIRDASGAVLPGVQLTLNSGAVGAPRTAVSDGVGRFAFRDVAPGRYSLVAVLPGFATLMNDLEIAAGASVEQRLDMRIGSLEEVIIVTCGSGAASFGRNMPGVLASAARASMDARSFIYGGRRESPALTQAPQSFPVRVGGQVQVSRKIKDAFPVCQQTVGMPAETLVVLEATIGTDGSVRDIKQLASKPAAEPPREYVAAAIEAVRQWEYTPTRLNNVPVPVIMTVKIAFRRS